MGVALAALCVLVAQAEPGAPRGLAETQTTTTSTISTTTPPVPPPSKPFEPPVDQPPPIVSPWEQYHDATLKLAEGDVREARRLFQALSDTFGDHPAGKRAAELLPSIRKPGAAPPLAPVPVELDPVVTAPQLELQESAADVEPDTALARAELAVFQTVHGIVFGAEFCVALECDDARAGIAAVLLSAGAGLGLSLGLSRSGLTAGHATLIDSATVWGGLNGFALLGAVQPSDFGGGAWATLMTLQLAGVGAGHFLYSQLEPTAGDVALTNSAGVWTVALTMMVHGAADEDPFSQESMLAFLLLTDAALVGGAYLAKYYPMSRSRVLLMDVGGILGGLVGAGVVLIIGGDGVSQEAGFTSTIIGTLAGLGGAAYLTRNWDAPDTPLQVGLLPYEDGGLLTVGGRF